jgi:tetratricopeptide (TPR) repeat protein
MSGYYYLALAWMVASPVLCAQGDGVRVREERLTLPTYNEGSPDPNPQFSSFYRDYFPNYPYAIRTPVNRIRHMVQWRVIVLENEYLTCRVIPDLGGHLHGCTDKITGREVFYANPSVRRGTENARGAFIATGIESSFPIAHSRVDSSPVDFAYSEGGGIGRAVVEDTDRVSGMEWRLEFILRPGSAVLEQRVTLHNASAARRGYHWWANAAIELDDPHLRFVYPVKWMLPHGAGSATPWPVNAAGVDLSDAANHKTQLGLFAHGSREPWMAVYKPAFRSGVAHYADPNEVRGKKLWLWGAEDKYVKERLTENSNSYVEMQAGVFETQPEFAFLLPGEVKTFTHFWIPFHDMGGISRATPDVVLNLRRIDRRAVLELNATHAMRGARLRLLDGARMVVEARVDLDPKVVCRKALDGAPAPLTVEVVDPSGTVVLHHVEGEYDAAPFDAKAKNPEPAAPSDSSGSEAGILALGEYNEQRDQFAFAWHDYEAGLGKFPGSVSLAKAAGRVAFTLNRFDDAIRLLAPVAAKNRDDAEAAYYYGAALASTGRSADARVSLTGATQDPRWAPAARLQLALMAAREGDVAAAVPLIQALAADAAAATRTGALEVAILRRAGRTDAAKQRLRFWQERDPADNMLRVERLLVGGGDDPSLWSHLAADPERVLNLVDLYFQIGAFDDGLKLLDRRYPSVPTNETEPGAVLPQDHPLVAYYRGFCRVKLGQDPSADFKAAGALSTLYVFPNRTSSYPVLKAALAQNDADAVAHSLLGNLYFDSLRTDLAIAEWRKALGLKPDLPALHRNLGRALLDINKDPAAALPVLQGGRQMDPDDSEIVEALKRTGARDTALSAEAGSKLANRALVRSVLDPDGAGSLFTADNFPKDKQPDTVRRAYIEVQLQRLLVRSHTGECSDALARLEKLGEEGHNLGFTFHGFGALMKPAHFQYYMGVIESACGAGKAAQKRWEKLSKTTEPIGSIDYVFPYLASWRLGEVEVRQKIAAAVQAVQSSRPADDSRMDLVFAQGMLEVAAGQHEEGGARLQKSAKAADPLIQYLSLVALRESSTEKPPARR